MVILFLTGCLEPGKDGVGDYTRLLARECVRQNHECLLVALNDPHVSAPAESTETEDGLQIPVLRLPSRLDWQKRVALATAFRARRPVQWTSLQFVSFGFDPKGMVRTLPRHLKPIIADSLLHIMFHELWIGGDSTDSLKKRVVGQIQRFYIQNLVRRLHPHAVTTSNPYYLSLLKVMGVPATELPLFGNIPVLPSGGNVPGILVRAGICNEAGLHPGRLLGLFFGALYPEWKPEPLMSILVAASKKTGTRVGLVSAGRLGRTGENAWKKLQASHGSVVDFISLGELSPHQISTLLQAADFGLPASPPYLIGKSGSAAAMLDHGLPVILARTDNPPDAPPSLPDDPLIHFCNEALESKLISGLPKRPARHRVTEVTHDFIRKLTELSQN